ncbi:MAG TPA: hypothetical protein VJ838_16325 [Gaiellaceae bacterium]|nr:hypothetical protein [Gaiellaceae bacterium]
MDWRDRYERAAARYAAGETRELDERQLVQLANAAWAAGLSLLMAGDLGGAGEWLRRSADRYRESWDAGTATDAWGRLIGAMKALLIAGADASEAAHWTLQTDAAITESPIGRYAAALALLIIGNDEWAARQASDLQRVKGFPREVADALEALATGNRTAYADAAERVRRSFDEREDFLEDVPVPDTALALDALAARRGLS